MAKTKRKKKSICTCFICLIIIDSNIPQSSEFLVHSFYEHLQMLYKLAFNIFPPRHDNLHGGCNPPVRDQWPRLWGVWIASSSMSKQIRHYKGLKKDTVMSCIPMMMCKVTIPVSSSPLNWNLLFKHDYSWADLSKSQRTKSLFIIPKLICYLHILFYFINLRPACVSHTILGDALETN